MKYIWIVMLAIGYITWLIDSIEDYIKCRKYFNHPFDHLKESTDWFIVINMFILFTISLAMFIKGLE